MNGAGGRTSLPPGTPTLSPEVKTGINPGGGKESLTTTARAEHGITGFEFMEKNQFRTEFFFKHQFALISHDILVKNDMLNLFMEKSPRNFFFAEIYRDFVGF